MDYNYKRRLELNEWVITTRWFYMVAVFLIGLLGNSLISLITIKSTFFAIGWVLLIFLVANSYLYRLFKQIKSDQSESRLKIFSVVQILLELLIFFSLFQLLGDQSLASVFFFLPIITSSLIFGIRGAVLTAVGAGLLVNSVTFFEYLDFFKAVFNGQIFSKEIFQSFQYATLNLIKVLVTTNFYFVIAIVSGYSSKILFLREKKLMDEAEKLNKERNDRLEETNMMFKQSKKIAKHDTLITKVNEQLSQKIKELETSEKSLFRTFADLQESRKSTEHEKEKTEAIVSNFIDPIIVIDKDNKLDLINPAARSLFGFLDDDLGKKILPDQNYSMNNFKTIVNADYTVKGPDKDKKIGPNEEELYINYANQALTYKVITAQVLDDHNNYLGVMKIFYNLTREKMIDKLKSEFISIAAHQLRTPLSAIKWVIKMVLDGDVGKLTEEQKKFLFKGYQSNERIIQLVNDMLNVSRIEEGRFGYSFSKDNIGEALDIVVDSLEGKIKERDINLEVTKPKKVPDVYMDRQKMTLVLQNLTENAVKYTPEHGKIQIKLEVGKEFLTVKVKDNGVGIPDKDQEKLFSKFFRADNVMRMQTEGSGLGLFIVKNIVKKHGGEISCESEEGIGTEFTVTLPLNKTEISS
jgi:signal transduction histidine kinase